MHATRTSDYDCSLVFNSMGGSGWEGSGARRPCLTLRLPCVFGLILWDWDWDWDSDCLRVSISLWLLDCLLAIADSPPVRFPLFLHPPHSIHHASIPSPAPRRPSVDPACFRFAE